MKNKLLLGTAVLVVGLLVCTSSASAALTYFDAQIVDIQLEKSVSLANTVMCDPGNNCAETPFTALPLGPGTEGPPPTTDPSGNWTLNGANSPTGTGSDNLWNQRFATPAPGNFGNPDASGNGTVYEAKGQFHGAGGPNPNTEDPPVLKTTINVAAPDQGTLKGVYALFWNDTSNWQIAACLECVEDEGMPVYYGGAQTPAGYVFGVYDVGVGDPGNLSNFDLEMNGYTTSDSIPGGTGGTGRRLRAAWLGNVVLGETLTAYVGDGPLAVLADPNGGGGHNARTWYDGIAYGDVQDLEPLPCVPEPASFVLLGIALAGLGLARRRGC